MRDWHFAVVILCVCMFGVGVVLYVKEELRELEARIVENTENSRILAETVTENMDLCRHMAEQNLILNYEKQFEE